MIGKATAIVMTVIEYSEKKYNLVISLNVGWKFKNGCGEVIAYSYTLFHYKKISPERKIFISDFLIVKYGNPEFTRWCLLSLGNVNLENNSDYLI